MARLQGAFPRALVGAGELAARGIRLPAPKLSMMCVGERQGKVAKTRQGPDHEVCG